MSIHMLLLMALAVFVGAVVVPALGRAYGEWRARR